MFSLLSVKLRRLAERFVYRCKFNPVKFYDKCYLVSHKLKRYHLTPLVALLKLYFYFRIALDALFFYCVKIYRSLTNF